MQLTILLGLCGLLGLTSAVSIREAAVQNTCTGGREYCGWFDQQNNQPPGCVCPSGQSWDSSSSQCLCPAIPKPSCPSGHQVICASSGNNYCPYDASNELCLDNGENIVLVVELELEVEILLELILQELSKPNCPYGQTYDSQSRTCKFPCFPEGPVQTCQAKGWQPICASSPQNYCDFDANNDLCQDNGVNAFHCVEPEAQYSVVTILGGIYSTISTSVSVLGLGCLRDWRSCSLSSGSWGSLCGCNAYSSGGESSYGSAYGFGSWGGGFGGGVSVSGGGSISGGYGISVSGGGSISVGSGGGYGGGSSSGGSSCGLLSFLWGCK